MALFYKIEVIPPDKTDTSSSAPGNSIALVHEKYLQAKAAADYDPRDAAISKANPPPTDSSKPTDPPAADPVKDEAKANADSVKNAEKNNNPSTPEELIAACGLQPYQVDYIVNKYGRMNVNFRLLMLNFLVYGFDYTTMVEYTDKNMTPAVMDQNTIRDFKAMANSSDAKLREYIQLTPAFKKGCFEGVGYFGSSHVIGNAQTANSPVSGPTKQAGTSLVEKLINGIVPGGVEKLENFLNKVRTHAYLSLPKGHYGSLQKMISKINGVIVAFEKLIHDIYAGCIALIQQVYAAINAIITNIERFILSWINKYIIPLDLLCLILAALQSFLGDVNFFSSLFNQSASISKYFNQFQGFLNTNAQLISNPFATVQKYFPPQVNQIINLVNQIGTDPNQALSTGLNNYGYHYALNALQGDLAAALVNKYGPQYTALTPLGSYLNSQIPNNTDYSAKFPITPAQFGPSIYQGPNAIATYANNTPVKPVSLTQQIVSNVKNPFATIGVSLSTIGQDFSDLGKSLNEAGSATKEFAGDVGTSASNVTNKIGVSVQSAFSKQPPI
jgi:hypothetical protein